MNNLVKLLFDSLTKLTGPLKGYRTALAAVAAVALGVAALSAGDVTMFALALTQLLAIVGLRPEDVPLMQFPDEDKAA